MRHPKNARDFLEQRPRLAPALRAMRHRWTAAALALMGLTGNAFAQQAQAPAEHRAAQAAASSEWQRFREGLRQAKPMPMPNRSPQDAAKSSVATPAGNIVGFDPKTGASHVIKPSLVETAAGPGRRAGFNGALPFPLSESSGSSVTEREVEGSSSTRSGPEVVRPFTTTPTAPSPFTTPYSFPFNTEFRLLLRFAVAGFPDKYYLCSASAAGSHHLLSAGHCVYNHDPLNDGSNRGASFAVEVWAWAAETDVVDPINPDTWEDYPYGVAKMNYETTYNNWINNSDLNADFSFINLDRRIGDHVGWMGREWGTNATSLNFDGYPAESPYVASDNPYQYPGFDANNVIAYTCCRIQMDAYTYGGHSGGGVWRYDSSAGSRSIEGVNSTSTRTGYAEATLYTSQTETDLQAAISANAVPVDRAQLIEYVFNGTSKGLLGTSVAAGDSFGFTLNAFNAGYAAAGDTVADVYLTTSSTSVTTGQYIGTLDLGSLNAYSVTVQNQFIRVPAGTSPGYYYVGWALFGANSQYGTDNNTAIITSQTLRVVGLSSVSVTPATLVGGASATGSVNLTGPAGSGGTTISLSSNSASLGVPSSVVVPAGASSTTFGVATSPVLKKAVATLTATGAGSQANATVSIQTSRLDTVTLNPVKVSGGSKSTATLALTGPAPTGGAKVVLSSSSTAASVPASVVIPAGSTTGTVTVSTSSVTATTTAAITGSYGQTATHHATLTIVPAATAELKSLTISPASVVGGTRATGTVHLTGAASAGGVVVSLSSGPKVTLPATVTVPSGQTTVSFSIGTLAVKTAKAFTVTAKHGTVKETAALTINP